jgi:replicative DNA helicase
VTRTIADIPEAVLAAERGVIGACMVSPRVLRDVELEVDDFFDLRHRAVFGSLRNLEHDGKPIDTLSVELQLEREGRLEAIGGLAKLIDLSLAPPVVEHVHEYARAVRSAATKRKVAVAAGDLLKRALDPKITGDDLLGEATTRFGAIDGASAENTATIGELAARRFADVERFAQDMAAGKVAVSGAPTGVRALDVKLGGWQFGIVNLVAARPGMGKSSLALATADATSESGMGAHVFSLEDSWHAYTDRQLARISRVPCVNIRRADLNREDVGELYAAMLKLKIRKGWIVDERGGLSAREIVRAVRRRAAKNGTRVVVVDYLQLLRANDPRAREDQQLGDSMAVFADAAKSDDMAYVVLSQFNRELERRVDKRPVLSDLRGSGEIEEKCKIAVGLYRGSYYGGKPKRDVDYECECPEAAKNCEHRPTLDAWESQAQCLILKGGNGPTGRVWASWHGPTVRIW